MVMMVLMVLVPNRLVPTEITGNESILSNYCRSFASHSKGAFLLVPKPV